MSSLLSWQNVLNFLTALSICTHSLLQRSRWDTKWQRIDQSREKKIWILDAHSKFELCFCLPKHIPEYIQLSFTQLHWLLCALKMSPWCMLHTSAKETKCGFLKTDCFQWLCFTFLCFIGTQFWLNWLYGWISESKKHFHRIKEGERGNNYMVSQHINNKIGSYIPWNINRNMLRWQWLERLTNTKRISLGDNHLLAVYRKTRNEACFWSSQSKGKRLDICVWGCLWPCEWL